MSRIRRGLAIACAWLAAMTAGAQFSALPASAAVEEQITERVFLVRDKPGTAAQFQMIVLAGCADEANGQCRGLAHYLEHLVLVGRNPEHSDSAVRFFADAGTNGHTSQRATVYVHSTPPRDTGPAADLERLFAFYAARLKNFSVTEADAARERNVVLQEHDWRIGSSPARSFERRLDRELLPDHPAGQWTMGTRESIASLTLADAQAFHRTWYVINNVYFVIKADITATALRAIAERTLAGLDTRQLPTRATLRQPAVPIESKRLTESDVKVKRASVTYKKLVRVENGDGIKQRAARTILLSYLRSRLKGSPHDVLVDETNVANGTPSISIDRAAPKTFTLKIAADVAPDVAPDALLAAISAYVDNLASVAPGHLTVERLKRRFADSRSNEDQDASAVYSRLTGWLANRSPYFEYASWPRRVAEISPADIAEAMAGLAGPGRVVSGVLQPVVEAAAK